MTIPDFLLTPHSHVLRVRFCETDQMGVAHHASYIPWIEEARTEWMRARGRSYREMEDAGLSLAVTRLSLRYLVSARYDDRIRIDTRLSDLRKASLDFEYQLYRVGADDVVTDAVTDGATDSASPVLVAQAETRLALIGRNGRPRRLTLDDLVPRS